MTFEYANKHNDILIDAARKYYFSLNVINKGELHINTSNLDDNI